MPYQPISRYHLLPSLTYSAFSRPRREQPDGTYQIHLVKSQNPAYIPSDLEAIRETRKKLAGLENLDVPPGHHAALSGTGSQPVARHQPVGWASSPPKATPKLPFTTNLQNRQDLQSTTYIRQPPRQLGPT